MLGLFFQLAPVAGSPTGSGSGSGFMSFLPMILIIVFMYLLVFLPESKRRKKLQKQIDNLKQGDKIVTIGHVVGIVDFIGEKTVYIKSLDSKLEIAKSGIASILNDGKIQ